MAKQKTPPTKVEPLRHPAQTQHHPPEDLRASGTEDEPAPGTKRARPVLSAINPIGTALSNLRIAQ